jgi:uncharacterized protein (TIGR03086 family)
VADEPDEVDPDVRSLAAALDVTARVIGRVGPGQRQLPTPCPGYDVGELVDHLVGFATRFADSANGVTPPTDPGTVAAGDDPERAYRAQAARLVRGYRDDLGGPGATSIGVVLMETVTHGWDLARATGQPAPFPDEPVERALAAGHGMLAPRFRGDGMAFAAEVEVPADARPLDRLVAFLGRDPAWSG